MDAREVSLREQAQGFPRSPGVYQWIADDGSVLYVGKAVDLRSRILSHLNAEPGSKSRTIASLAKAIDYIAVANEKEALVLEQTLIKRLKPRYNVRLTDGRGYPYLKLTKERFPRLLKVHEILDDKATYFGPFPDGYGCFHLQQVLLDVFPLRRCKTLPKVKCLYYDIGQCAGPCIDVCTEEEYAEITKQLRRVLRGDVAPLMKRIRQEVEDHAMQGEFEDAARKRDQLVALTGVLQKQSVFVDRLEDRDIAAIAREGAMAVVVLLHQREGKILGHSPYFVDASSEESDAEILYPFLVSYYQDKPVPGHIMAELDEPTMVALRHDLSVLKGRAPDVRNPQRGDGKRWLEIANRNAELRLVEERESRQRKGVGAVQALQERLKLPTPPNRIEGFDISHHGGNHTRAAMVRFLDGAPEKGSYRTFVMRDVGQMAVDQGTAKIQRGAGREIDDFASMYEAVHRRYRPEYQERWGVPDLIVIDGGKGQLQAAQRALREHGLDHVGLLSLAKQEEEIFLPGKLHAVRLPKHDPALQLLQRVRDESHRFGIQQVRRKASDAVLRSPLDGIAGLGPARKKALLQAFGGLQGIQTASAEQLAAVNGVGPALASAIYATLHPES